MASPAQRHAMRVSAMKAAQREHAPLRHATAYEQMLVKLAADRRTLKSIHSKEAKAAKKAELLPFYLPWVTGALETGTGAQDDILMTVMLWRLDAGQLAGALEIAHYALRYKLATPDGHARTAPYMLAEEFALSALRARDGGQSVDVSLLLGVLELVHDADMPDEVKARLHKVIGLTLRDAGNPTAALEHLIRAVQLDRNAGVRKDIENLTRLLNPKPATPKKLPAVKAPARKTTATKQNSAVKRGRGRPKKVTS